MDKMIILVEKTRLEFHLSPDALNTGAAGRYSPQKIAPLVIVLRSVEKFMGFQAWYFHLAIVF
jgi:hypothetical protein